VIVSEKAKKENPITGIITIPSPGGDGFIRVNEDGVIASYTNPAKSIFPYMDLSSRGNITTGLDSLHSFTLPAGSLAFDGDCLWVRYGGLFAANDNDKRIRISFGGVEVHNPGLFDQDVGAGWHYDIIYARVNPTTIRVDLFLMWAFGNRDGAGTVGGNYIFAAGIVTATPVNNLNTSDNILLVQGEATATDDIIQNFSYIDRFRPNTVVLT
jgi:hypothetical protein